MKKRLLFLCSALLLTCTLFTGCGQSNEDTKALLSYEYENEMRDMAGELNSLDNTDAETIAQIESNVDARVQANSLTEDQGDMLKELVEDYAEVKSDDNNIGDFKDYGDFTLEKAGKTYTATQVLHYANRDVNLVYVISAYDQSVTSMNCEIVYTTGEKMKKAGLNTIMGISIVFIMLVLMSIIIYCFNIIPYIEKKIKDKNNTKQETSKEVIVAVDEVETEDVTDDLEIVAVITAAICASTGESTDDFVVRSIRRRV